MNKSANHLKWTIKKNFDQEFFHFAYLWFLTQLRNYRIGTKRARIYGKGCRSGIIIAPIMIVGFLLRCEALSLYGYGYGSIIVAIAARFIFYYEHRNLIWTRLYTLKRCYCFISALYMHIFLSYHYIYIHKHIRTAKSPFIASASKVKLHLIICANECIIYFFISHSTSSLYMRYEP